MKYKEKQNYIIPSVGTFPSIALKYISELIFLSKHNKVNVKFVYS